MLNNAWNLCSDTNTHEIYLTCVTSDKLSNISLLSSLTERTRGRLQLFVRTKSDAVPKKLTLLLHRAMLSKVLLLSHELYRKTPSKVVKPLSASLKPSFHRSQQIWI